MTIEKNSQYTFHENKLELRVKKAPLLLRCFLAILTLLSLIVAFTYLYRLFGGYEKVTAISLIINLALFYAAIFFLRTTLWNSFGQELLTFSDNEIKYIADYKLFKDGAIEIENCQDLQVFINSEGKEKDKFGTITLKTMDQEINCVTKMTIENCNEIVNLINYRLHSD
jgi:hypothetical protein